MTQGSGEELTIAQLGKRLEEQARFTRIVFIFCTLTIVGVLYLTMTSQLQVLPDLVMAKFMGNMEPLVGEYKLAEQVVNKKAAAAGAANKASTTVVK